jgi:two-component system, NarL family, invasion response regulator UvrY
VTGRQGPVGVLVVDDQRPFLRAVRRVLDRADGFVVVGEATSGEEAVAAVAGLAPGLVVMDVMLPGINGIEATRRIVAADPSAIVVLVSTRRASELPEGWSTCGAAAFVPKEEFGVEVLAGLLPR